MNFRLRLRLLLAVLLLLAFLGFGLLRLGGLSSLGSLQRLLVGNRNDELRLVDAEGRTTHPAHVVTRHDGLDNMLSWRNLTDASATQLTLQTYIAKLPSARNGTRFSKSISMRDSSGTEVESAVSCRSEDFEAKG